MSENGFYRIFFKSKKPLGCGWVSIEIDRERKVAAFYNMQGNIIASYTFDGNPYNGLGAYFLSDVREVYREAYNLGATRHRYPQGVFIMDENLPQKIEEKFNRRKPVLKIMEVKEQSTSAQAGTSPHSQ